MLYINHKYSVHIWSCITTGPNKAKFHMEPQLVGGTNVCLPHLGHMTKMAAMSIYGKKPFPEPKGQWP